MADLIEVGELIWALIPFIIGIIAIAAIPSKDKIINRQVKKYHVEVLIVVYLIAFFILAIGMYYLISLDRTLVMYSYDNYNLLVNFLSHLYHEFLMLDILWQK